MSALPHQPWTPYITVSECYVYFSFLKAFEAEDQTDTCLPCSASTWTSCPRQWVSHHTDMHTHTHKHVAASRCFNGLVLMRVLFGAVRWPWAMQIDTNSMLAALEVTTQTMYVYADVVFLCVIIFFRVSFITPNYYFSQCFKTISTHLSSLMV